MGAEVRLCCSCLSGIRREPGMWGAEKKKREFDVSDQYLVVDLK